MEKSIDVNIRGLKNNKIGIMGGTFDPIHYAHLFIAQTALCELNLDKILFIPSGKPPHKRDNIITNPDKRIHMLKLATQSNLRFEISSIEIDRQKTSYTVDTLKDLYRYYGKETQFYFIVGSDAFEYIETWNEYEKLFKMAKFIVMTRQISKNGSLDEQVRRLIKKYNADITKIEIPFLEISSTIIRKRVKEGRHIKYLLPKNVERYIFNNKLYVD